MKEDAAIGKSVIDIATGEINENEIAATFSMLMFL